MASVPRKKKTAEGPGDVPGRPSTAQPSNPIHQVSFFSTVTSSVTRVPAKTPLRDFWAERRQPIMLYSQAIRWVMFPFAGQIYTGHTGQLHKLHELRAPFAVLRIS